MTEIAELKRVRIAKRHKTDEETKQLARDAALILDYDDLADEVLGSPDRLTDVLRALDIRPFDQSAVDNYQREKRQALDKEDGGYHYWEREQLKNSHGIPQFVLRKAIAIKRACPDVKLFVESLESDPFLVAQLAKDIFYIEAWGESDFEKGL